MANINFDNLMDITDPLKIIDRPNQQLDYVSKSVFGNRTRKKKNKPTKSNKVSNFVMRDENTNTRISNISSTTPVFNADEYFPSKISVLSNLKIDESDLVWICIRSYNIKSMSAMYRDLGGHKNRAENTLPIELGCATYSLHFLASNELTESTQHEWQAYESIGSRVAEKAGELKRMKKELEGSSGTTINGLEDAPKIIGGITSQMAGSGTNALAWGRMLSAADVDFSRVDAPLVYKNSNRREFQFTFNLVATDSPEDCYNDVVYPVKLLQYLSSPSLGEDNFLARNTISQIYPPNVFSVYTEPDNIDFINLTYAALTNIQPTFRGPYLGGYPTSCELQLTFQDDMPLYDDTFFTTSVVTTVNSQQSTNR